MQLTLKLFACVLSVNHLESLNYMLYLSIMIQLLPIIPVLGAYISEALQPFVEGCTKCHPIETFCLIMLLLRH
jgi:uncharacterized membrane protein